MSWTEERVELLKTHWADGLSCAAIANELGGTTRNAVIGKVHRLGLAGRGSALPRPAPQPRPRSVKATNYRRKSLPSGPVDLPPETVANPVGFAELKDHHCRWPVDGAGYQTLFCGADRFEKLAYCGRHCLMAYRPPERRSRADMETELRKARAKARRAAA